MLLWINDALMAVFFLLVGLEVKRELVLGSLASKQRAAFPVIAALGGMVVPALLFPAFTRRIRLLATAGPFRPPRISPLRSGYWPAGQPRADGVKIFLMALAIIDDLGAIIIIALFYTSDLSVLSLSVAAGAIAVLALLNVFNVRRIGIYMLVGVVLWTAVLKSGVHATLAG